MPVLHTKHLQVEIPAGWKYRYGSVVGYGSCLAVAAGLLCIVIGWLLSGWGSGGAARWLLIFGSGLVLLALFFPLVFSLLWFRSREMKSGLPSPRLTRELRDRPLLVVGPEGQWLHLTADDLRPGERPMDSDELQQSLQRRYGDRVIDEGWLPVGNQGHPSESGFASGAAHWFTYLLAEKTHKKYTVYLRSKDAQVEVIVTAKLRDPPNSAFERQYDRIVQSISIPNSNRFAGLIDTSRRETF